MDLKPQHKLGEYTVLRKLAEGGMAEIYLATRGGASGFSKNCVIKRVKDQHRQDDKFRAMFELEAKLAANLEHSNIVQIFDFQSTEDGELYLAMQYVDGCSLEQLRHRMPGGIVPAYLAARIARQVASALGYAYDCPGPDGSPLRLVHRDISPHNVLLSRQGEVKLTDFGIAKPVSKDTTGGFKGKIAYMSPEQARGSAVDGRTDIFALGVVLFELCTGSRPYDAPTDLAFILEMASGSTPAPRASEMGTPVPEPLADILDKAVQRRPENRFQTAEELGRALDDFLRTAPSAVETDLARFMVERVGTHQPESGEVVQLATHAFDETMASPVRLPTAVLVSGSSSSEAEPPRTQKMRSSPALTALKPATGPSRSVQISPELRAPERPHSGPTEPEDPEAFETVEAKLDGMNKESAPAVVAPIFTRPVKLALAVLVPVVVAGSAYFAYVKSQAPMTVINVPAPQRAAAAPVLAKVAVVEPKQVQAEPVIVPPPVEAKAAVQPAPAAPAEPKKVAVAEVAPPAEAEEPTAAHRPPVTDVKGEGVLRLETQPYAEIYEGKQVLSEDGTKTLSLPAGKHVLRYHWNGSIYPHHIFVPPNGRVCVKAVFTQKARPAFSTCR